MIGPRRGIVPVAWLVLLAVVGCGDDNIDTSYGRIRNPSVNGTRVFAEMLEADGHTVKGAVRLNEELGTWAEVVVRFAPRAGLPDNEEADWYLGWLDARPGRCLVYVPRGFDAAEEYWTRVLALMPADADPRLVKRAEERRKAASEANSAQATSSTEVSRAWFRLEDTPATAGAAGRLEGPWALGLDPGPARLSLRGVIEPGEGRPLLLGDGKLLASENVRPSGSRILTLASGTFLLNGALLNRARRPLAERVVDWVGGPPRNVAFVEGSFLLEEPEQRSPLALLGVPPFGWIAVHLGVLGLVACLARAPRLGRPRSNGSDDLERPSAHPEALGSMMARGGDAPAARALLETYRAWRHPGGMPARSPGPEPVTEPEPAERPRRFADW